MNYRDSSSSGSGSTVNEDYGDNPMTMSSERSARAFKHSAQHAVDAQATRTPGTTTGSARVGEVKTTVPLHVATNLHSRLAVHSDDEDRNSHQSASEPANEEGFNSTVFVARPAAPAVRKFHVLDSGDDDEATSDADQQEPTPSRNKGLRDGQNVSVTSSHHDETTHTASSSSSVTSGVKARHLPPPPPASDRVPTTSTAAPTTLMVKRMLPPTPSLSSSSSSDLPPRRTADVDGSDDSETAEQQHPRRSLLAGGASPHARAVAGGTTSDTAPERQHPSDGATVHDDATGLGGTAAAATARTLEKMHPSTSQSLCSSADAGERLSTVTEALITSPTGPTSAGAADEAVAAPTAPAHARRASATSGRMLPPPSTESSASSSSSSTDMREPPSRHTITGSQRIAPPLSSDDDDDDKDTTSRAQKEGESEEPSTRTDDNDDDDEDEAVVFHDDPRAAAGVDGTVADDPLDREFPIQEWGPDMFADMVLLDSTPFSAVYECSEILPDEEDVALDSHFKLLAPFAGVWGDGGIAVSQMNDGDAEDENEGPRRLVRASQREEVNRAQSDLQRLASWMMHHQLQVADYGLTAPCGPDAAACCRGAASLSVDREARLLAELEVEPCTLPLSTVLAFTSTVPLQADIVALLGSITLKVAMLHQHGLVHGALHAGNVLCSTDDGHTVLTQPCGVAALLALPADASFFTPREACQLWPLVEEVWVSAVAYPAGPRNAPRAGRLGVPVNGGDTADKIKQHTQRWLAASEEALAAAALTVDGPATTKAEAAGMVLPWLGRVLPADDVYAVGLLLLALLTGVPAYHGIATKDVLTSLAHLAAEAETVAAAADGERREAVQRWAVETLVMPALRTELFTARAALAGYTPAFIELCARFIGDCLCEGFTCATTGAGRRYRTAVELLQHPFFQRHLPDYTAGPDAMSADDDARLTVQAQLDQVHRFVYPVYTLLCSVEAGCGSAPYLPRAHRNAIFSARRDALTAASAVTGLAAAPTPAISGAAALWPSLEGWPVHGWSPAHPSVTSCATPASDTRGADSLTCELYNPQCTRTAAVTGSAVLNSEALAVQEKKKLETEKDCRVLLNLHTILFENLTGAAVSLNREDMAPLRTSVDKLILRQLHRCRVEVLAHFRYVVLDHVTDCEIVLGPCFACYMQNVHVCPVIAVACTYMVLEQVSDSAVQFAGLNAPSAKEGTVHDVRLQPYSVSYAGLSEDYAAVGLAPEHVLTLPFFDATTATPVRRALRYLRAGDTTAQDFPYAVPLVATGNSFVHRDDNASDVYVLYNELRGKDVVIERIRGGGSVSSPGFSTHVDVLQALGAFSERRDDHSRGTDAQGDAVVAPHGRRPLIFILDTVGDVKIEHCSHCTIFVVGATGSAEVRHCHDMQLFIMARECSLEHCEQVHVHALVTEFMAVVRCRQLVVEPLILQCPYFDTVLDAVLEASGGSGSDDEQATMDALLSARDVGDAETLNVVFQGSGREIEITECEQVEVHDLEWLAMNPSAALTMITVPVPALPLDEEVSEDVGESEPGVSSHPAVASCQLFERYCRRHRTTQEAFFLQASFADVLSRHDEGHHHGEVTARPIVKMHNLLAAAVFRMRGGLHLRALATTPATPDLVLEQLHLGEVHISDAVGNVLIRRCTGPLEIALCGAQSVLLEGCVNVTVRVACRAVFAQDCHHCHIAAHVNREPQYLRCSSMLTSTLNMTSEGMESILEAAGVDSGVNRFDSPVIKPAALSHVFEEADTRAPVGDAGDSVHDIHVYCSETCVDVALASSPTSPSTCRVTGMADCFGVLCRPVTVVPPLPGLCVGVTEAPFVESLEARVNKEESRRLPLDSLLMAALAFLTSEEVDLSALDRAMPTRRERGAATTVDKAPPHPSESSSEVEAAVPPADQSQACADGEEGGATRDGAVSLQRVDAQETQTFTEEHVVSQPVAAAVAESGALSVGSPSPPPQSEDADSPRQPSGTDTEDAPAAGTSHVSSRSPDLDESCVVTETELVTSGVEQSNTIQHIREATRDMTSSPLFVNAGLPLAPQHGVVNTSLPMGEDGSPGDAQKPQDTFTVVVPGAASSVEDREGTAVGDTDRFVRVAALASDGSCLPTEQQSLYVEESIQPPKSSVLTTGLSMASPPAILRAPAQEALSAHSPGLTSGGGVEKMAHVDPFVPASTADSNSLPRHTESSSPAAMRQEDDDADEGSSVNLADTAREVSYSSSAQSYQRGREGEQGSGARYGVGGERHPRAFLNLDDNDVTATDKNAGDALPHERWSSPAHTALHDIPYVQDEKERQRMLAAVIADDSTKERLSELLDELHEARVAYEEVVAQQSEALMEVRVESALRILTATRSP